MMIWRNFIIENWKRSALLPLVFILQACIATKVDIQNKLDEFTQRDFAAELEEKLDKEQEALIEALSESVKNLSVIIDKINTLVAQSATDGSELKEALDDLNTVRNNLDKELEKNRHRAAAIGSTAATLFKSAASKMLTGVL